MVTHYSIEFYDSIGVDLNGAADRCAVNSEKWVATCRINFLVQVCVQKKTSSKLKYGSRKWGFQADFLRMRGYYSDHIRRGEEKRSI